MCSRLEGRYALTTDDRKGDCGDIPESTPLVVTDQRPGYSLEARWLEGCVLRASHPGSCEYGARCQAVVGGAPRPLVLSVTRNSSGFYGPARITTTPHACTLQVDTSAP